MKSFLHLSLILLLAHQSVAHENSSGLVPNGDFELEDKGALAGWMPFDTVPDMVPNNVRGVPGGYFEFIWDTASEGGGKGSLLLRGKGNRLPVFLGVSPLTAHGETVAYIISPKMPVQENAEYKLTYSIKTSGMADPETKQPARLAFEFRFYTGNGKLVPVSGEAFATKTPETWQPRTMPPATTRGLATGDLEFLARPDPAEVPA